MHVTEGITASTSLPVQDICMLLRVLLLLLQFQFRIGMLALRKAEKHANKVQLTEDIIQEAVMQQGGKYCAIWFCRARSLARFMQ